MGVGGYRSPGLRPSPGSSPGASTGDSGGGGGGISGDHSVPCSPRDAVHAAPYDPGATYHSVEDGFLLTQMALQQHFEQCSMVSLIIYYYIYYLYITISIFLFLFYDNTEKIAYYLSYATYIFLLYFSC